MYLHLLNLPVPPIPLDVFHVKEILERVPIGDDAEGVGGLGFTKNRSTANYFERFSDNLAEIRFLHDHVIVDPRRNFHLGSEPD